MFVSTALVVMIGVGGALVGGLIVGYFYFRLTDRRRTQLSTYTDAGGMTRLNLDGFTPEMSAGKLLNE
jgi:hypothetical protein